VQGDGVQCGGCGQIRTGAAGPRVEDVGGCRGEGSGRHDPDAGRSRSSWRRAAVARTVMARQVRKEQLRSGKAVRAEATQRRFNA
jgi:hypothetical protein